MLLRIFTIPVLQLILFTIDTTMAHGSCSFSSSLSNGRNYLKADCTRQHLENTPQSLPGFTGILDMSKNKIKELGVSLQKYNQLKVLSIGCNPLQSLTADNFKNLTSLEELHINNNIHLLKLDRRLFNHLPNLKTLNMACSRNVGFSAILEVLEDAPFLLDTLVLDAVVKIYDYVILKKETLNFPSVKSLRRLSLRHNNIISVDLRFLVPLVQLEHFSVGYNSILKLLPDDSWGCLLDVISCTNIITLDASNIFNNPWTVMYCSGCKSEVSEFFQQPKYFVTDLNRVISNETSSGGWCNMDVDTCGRITWAPQGTPMPRTLRYVYASGVLTWQKGRTFKGSHYRTNNLQYLNISGFAMKGFTSAITGWDSLEVLDASRCGLSVLPRGFLTNFPRLRILKLQQNEFTDINTVIVNVKHLEVLDISRNNIVTLNNDVFLGFHRLQELDISGNLLHNLDLGLSKFNSLGYIDISSNLIQRFDDTLMNQLDKLSNFNNLTISIQGNPLVCTCESLPFVNWLQNILNGTDNIRSHERDVLHCLYKNTTNSLLNTVSTNDLEESCVGTITVENLLKTVLAPVCTIIAVFVLAAGLCYRLRWQIWWELHVTFRKCTDKDNVNFTNHTFVACNDSNMASNFIQYLQQNTDNDISSSKDIGHNEPEIEANGRMMEASRQILLFIDVDFIENLPQWDLLVPSILESRSLKMIALVLGFNVTDCDVRDSYLLWRLCKSDCLLGHYNDQVNNAKLRKKLLSFLKAPAEVCQNFDMTIQNEREVYLDDGSIHESTTDDRNMQMEIVALDAPLIAMC